MHQNNVLWVISHPDNLRLVHEESPDMFVAFSRIFCASKQFCSTLERMSGKQVEWLPAPPPDRPIPDAAVEHDLIFVGNADPGKGRLSMIDTLLKNDSKVYGQSWKGKLNGEHGGDYTPWDSLHNTWSTGRIVPYSSCEDMSREGFVPDSCLDTMVNSTAFLIPDVNDGFQEMGISIPQWTSAKDLQGKVEYYLENDSERENIRIDAKRDASRFTNEAAAKKLVTCL